MFDVEMLCQLNKLKGSTSHGDDAKLRFFLDKGHMSGLYIRGCTQPIITEFTKRKEQASL